MNQGPLNMKRSIFEEMIDAEKRYQLFIDLPNEFLNTTYFSGSFESNDKSSRQKLKHIPSDTENVMSSYTANCDLSVLYQVDSDEETVRSLGIMKKLDNDHLS